jgi:hypothetical protein
MDVVEDRKILKELENTNKKLDKIIELLSIKKD